MTYVLSGLKALQQLLVPDASTECIADICCWFYLKSSLNPFFSCVGVGHSIVHGDTENVLRFCDKQPQLLIRWQ
jgi:hypothetical protein